MRYDFNHNITLFECCHYFLYGLVFRPFNGNNNLFDMMLFNNFRQISIVNQVGKVRL